MQKVRSNWARPIGSAAHFGREILPDENPAARARAVSPLRQLGQDIHARGQAARQNSNQPDLVKQNSLRAQIKAAAHSAVRKPERQFGIGSKQAAKTYYHGTDSKNLKAILERGLDPAFAGTGADSGVPTDIPGYEQRVFLATHPQLNSGYGDTRLQIDVPDDFEVKPLFNWPFNAVLTDHYTTKKIPPEYIKVLAARAEQAKQADGAGTGLDLNSFKFKTAPSPPVPLTPPPQNPQAYTQWQNTLQTQVNKLPIPSWIKDPGVGMRATFSSQRQQADQPYSSAYDPAVHRATLGSQIGRWYQNAGGLDTAINSAQQAQQNRDTSVLDPQLWSKWKPEHVTQWQQPVIVSPARLAATNKDRTSAGALNAGAFYSPSFSETETYTPPPTKSWFGGSKSQTPVERRYVSEPSVVVSRSPADKIIESRSQLEHELTHGATQVGDEIASKSDSDIANAFLAAGRPASLGEEAFGPEFKKMKDDEYARKINYLSEPTEIDVRLAEIKRRYAHHTGTLVETPAQAQKAWDWWRENRALLGQNRRDENAYMRDQSQLNQISPEQRPEFVPADYPTFNSWDFDTYYDRLPDDQKQKLFHRMPEVVQGNQASQKFGAALRKQAELVPDVQLQEHQQRIADRAAEQDPKLLVYHGLGSGKSLSAIAAAEAAKKLHGENYGVVVPASLRGNFQKEIKKFTRGSDPEIISYTGLALGKDFQEQPDTLVMDEAHRLRNPESASTQAARDLARKAKRVLLLTGSPITNSPTELASLISLLQDKPISPETFEKRYIDYKKVSPGWLNWLRGIKPGEQPVVKNEKELRQLLQGKVDYHPSKTPEGVNVKEDIIRVPLSRDQQKIQTAIRTKIPPGFLWKLDQEFPLSRDELSRLNSFLNGLRQVSLSTQPFRADKDPAKAFSQSAKLQLAMKNLQKTLAEDPRKKAIIYSNFIDSGINPYSAALEKAKIPHGVFHGSVPVKQRQQALKDYNEGRLRALLLGPAAAEGISTKGTSLIQLLDPHWHESRTQQAKGRGLRFDSHRDLPEELKNVAVQRYLSSSEDPSWLGKLLGYQRERTGDEILEKLTADKETLNETFRKILREVGSEKQSAATNKMSA
jgi:hypothetical protein